MQWWMKKPPLHEFSFYKGNAKSHFHGFLEKYNERSALTFKNNENEKKATRERFSRSKIMKMRKKQRESVSHVQK